MSLPKTTDQWILKEQKGIDSLQIERDVQIPELGDWDCLVQIQAVSLNYRDLVITQGKYPFPYKMPVVPCSDGAGFILAVGKNVTEFKVGDQVCTLFNQLHLAGDITPRINATGLGGAYDGTLRQFGVFPEHGLVAAPSNLSPSEAGTLTCAPLTAWNALYGLGSKALKPGQTVLTQGTGGVSIAAVQFAVAAGANVIATTSSDDKAELLRKLGATTVINYKTTPNWGEVAKSASPDQAGVDHIIEVGGPGTIEQSIKAIKMQGVISLIGFLGGQDAEKESLALGALLNSFIIRGILIGSRQEFQAMNRAIDANNIHPIVDKIFTFDQVKEAYQYLLDQKHIGKVVIQPGKLE